MPQLNSPIYRRDYTGEPLTYVENGEYKSLFVTPRTLPYDRSVKNAIVLGNGISRLDSQIQLILNQNNTRVAEGYKTTYACNAAYRDTPADYYVVKNAIFFSEIPTNIYNKIFVQNDIWLAYRDCNLTPSVWYMDSGSTAAYLAAFDGAERVFLFGFDGNDNITNDNIYAKTLGYDNIQYDHQKHSYNLYEIAKVYNNVQFYRVRNEYSFDYPNDLSTLPNYNEISIRQAVLEGDF